MVLLPSTELAETLSSVSMVTGIVFFVVSLYLFFIRANTSEKTKIIHISVGLALVTFIVGNMFYSLYHIPKERWNAIEEEYGVEITDKEVSNREGLNQVTYDVTYNDGRTISQGEVIIESNYATLYSSETGEPVPFAVE